MSDPDPCWGLKDVFPQVLEVSPVEIALAKETYLVRGHIPSHWYPMIDPCRVQGLESIALTWGNSERSSQIQSSPWGCLNPLGLHGSLISPSAPSCSPPPLLFHWYWSQEHPLISWTIKSVSRSASWETQPCHTRIDF